MTRRVPPAAAARVKLTIENVPGRPLREAPGLDDPLARAELVVSAGDVAVEGGELLTRRMARHTTHPGQGGQGAGVGQDGVNLGRFGGDQGLLGDAHGRCPFWIVLASTR